MRVARAFLRDGKRVDSQGFKIRAHLGDGPDESGSPGHGGGPALDAGHSRAHNQGLKLRAKGSQSAAGGDRKRCYGLPEGRLGIWPG